MKRVFSFMLACTMAVVGVSLTGCEADDDPNQIPGDPVQGPAGVE